MCQKDVHFGATLAVAKEAGISKDTARLIAWSNYQTDCTWLTTNHLFSKAGRYYHFLPGDGDDRLVTTENCTIAKELIKQAETPIQLGIALHSFQDTFSHRNFSGTYSRKNNTQPWAQFWPHYGHCAVFKSPDIANATWFDGRLADSYVSNIPRFTRALAETYRALGGTGIAGWKTSSVILKVLYEQDYETRKRKWSVLAGTNGLRFSHIKDDMWAAYKKDWLKAAKRQRDIVKELI